MYFYHGDMNDISEQGKLDYLMSLQQYEEMQEDLARAEYEKQLAYEEYMKKQKQ